MPLPKDVVSELAERVGKIALENLSSIALSPTSLRPLSFPKHPSSYLVGKMKMSWYYGLRQRGSEEMEGEQVVSLDRIVKLGMSLNSITFEKAKVIGDSDAYHLIAEEK